jgi:hypothetical protein
MRFQATLVLKLNAASIAEAGEKLNELLEHAQHAGGIEVEHLQVGTPERGGPVTLPRLVPSPPPAPMPPRPPSRSNGE